MSDPVRVVYPLAAPGPVNGYLVDLGPDGVVAIDSGPPGPEARATLRAALAGLGRVPGDVRAVLLTHAHRDHAGQAAWLAREAGAEVFLHPAEARSLAWDALARGCELLAACGCPPAEAERLAADLAWARGFEPPAAWRALAPGAVVRLGSWEVRALATPGHADGHLALLDPAGRAFTGDALLPGLPPLPLAEDLAPATDGGPLAAALRGLEALRAAAPVQALPGHGQPFAGVAERVEEVLAHIARRRRRIAGLLDPSGTLVRELAARLYPGASGLLLLFAIGEVLAYLLALEADGLAELRRTPPLAARPAR